jgi:hypothetical protein
MLVQFGFNNLCSNYGDFNFFSKNTATFHPKKPLLFYATPIWFPTKVDVVS